ncbi:MAG: guanosine-3,5-bis(diphosphate) 3-pyrophosphohydrolase [Candidatus Parcubacteria bacterium]|jgi:myo-inositol-1(or 4)-monophosphatase
MNIHNHERLSDAIQFANWAHRKQKRKLTDAPYIMHPCHGTMLLMCHGLSIDDPLEFIAIIAETLHDTHEDNPKEVSLPLINETFGYDVARVVFGVTLDPTNPDKRRARQKILRADWIVRIVKVADILSNTISTTSVVRKRGLAVVQKHFSQPISDRVRMERAFFEKSLPEKR